MADVPVSTNLALLPLGSRATVLAVTAPAHAPQWASMLEELGFAPGEPVALLARAALGGDPIVARVGVSTFALRLAEASCVHVQPVEALASDLASRPEGIAPACESRQPAP